MGLAEPCRRPDGPGSMARTGVAIPGWGTGRASGGSATSEFPPDPGTPAVDVADAVADLTLPTSQGPTARPPRAPSTEGGDRGVALLLATAAVVAAIITLVALNSANDASGAWQSSLRQDVKRGVAAVEDIRFIYEVEGPAAFQVATQEVQAQEYRTAASSAAPDIRTQLDARAQVLEMTVEALRPSVAMAVPAYALSAGGYDVLKRLSERLADPTRIVTDPDATMALGDAAAARADRLIDSIVVIGFAFLFGALAQTFTSARRKLLAMGWLVLGMGVLAAFTGGLLL